MHKIATLAMALVLGIGMMACSCPAAKRSAAEVKRSHEIISKQLLVYVEKDASLSAEDKDDWKKLVESDRRNIEALERALED